jgi:UDP:flavonoid glycosyltransferase YjiC (YdhE family)
MQSNANGLASASPFRVYDHWLPSRAGSRHDVAQEAGSLKAIILAAGTSGDVHPLVAVGKELLRRGHDVHLVAAEPFRSLAQDLELEFHGLGTDESFESAVHDPALWRPATAFRTIARHMKPMLSESYDVLARLYVPGETVCLASSLAFSARVAQEALGLPVATGHLQPSSFASVEATPYMGMPVTRHSPLLLRRIAIRIADAFFDAIFAPTINELRSDVGLSPIRRVWSRWWHSPQCVIALFADWYCPLRTDWPPQTHQLGFPLYDQGDVDPMPGPLLDFLHETDPPVVFAPGSGNAQAERFFRAGMTACQLTGRRAVLLTRYREQLPSDLPPGVIHVEYAPFGALLRRSAALVHHGGIGTAAQGMAAGIPQVVMPMAFDQPDNARRLSALGVADWLSPRAFTGARVAQALERLLGDAAVRDACTRLAEHISGQSPPAAAAADLVEALRGTDGQAMADEGARRER